MPRGRTIYIKNPRSGSHFRQIKHGSTTVAPQPGGPGLVPVIYTPPAPKPPISIKPRKKKDSGPYAKYAEWWHKQYAFIDQMQAQRAKERKRMVRNIEKMLKRAGLTAADPALLAELAKLRAELLNRDLSEPVDQVLADAKREIANQLFPKYGDATPFMAGLLVFAAIVGGEALITTKGAELFARPNPVAATVFDNVKVYETGLFFSKSSVLNPLTGMPFTANQIAALQAIPQGLNHSQTISAIYSAFLLP